MNYGDAQRGGDAVMGRREIRPEGGPPTDLQAIHTAINTSHRYEREAPGRDDWQTPAEFDASGVGDCEDFAIRYWYALRDFPGMARLAGCMRSDGQTHMVCLYSPEGRRGEACLAPTDPVVFDVAVDAVCRLSERPDLLVMYELDVAGIHSRYGSHPPTRVAPWAGVLARM